jgi:peptidoglycan/LPS O-acetylase OafA/YrhL
MSSPSVAQVGEDRAVASHKVDSLTGVRAVAAMTVVLTHAAYSTGKYGLGYGGAFLSRMEIGVPIFFVLSGFLLFAPWVRKAAAGDMAPSVRRYAWHRVRRIMPAYVITVLIAYTYYHFRKGGPNPGHTWIGLLRNLTLTQIYSDEYVYTYLHQGLIQMWSLAVEVSFYLVLPLIAYLLLVVLCKRRWQPVRLVVGLLVLALITPAWIALFHTTGWLPGGARLWLPTYLAWFIGGMLLAVWQQMGVRAYGFVCLPLVVICFLIAATPIAGAPTTTPAQLSEGLVKAAFYAVIATLVVAPLALGNRGWYAKLLGCRPMVFLGEISYEIFLIHLMTMEFTMIEILRFPMYNGSYVWLFVATMVVTVPLAWLLHRFTRVKT